jgi:hypothetical protein
MCPELRVLHFATTIGAADPITTLRRSGWAFYSSNHPLPLQFKYRAVGEHIQMTTLCIITEL